MMASLLPERVGGLLGLDSIRKDLEAGRVTVKRWLTGLKELHYLFEIKPYQRSIPRTLKKEGKLSGLFLFIRPILRNILG